MTRGQRILFGMISGIMFLVSPVISFIALILKPFKIDLYRHTPHPKRHPMVNYVIAKWLGQSTSAQHNRTFALFVMPVLGIFGMFVIYTFLSGVWFSMTNWNGLNTGREVFVGLANYISIVNDYAFFYSLYKTALYSILSIFSINIAAFTLALLVTQNLKLKNIYRAGFFLPNLIGGLVLGYIWQFIFNRAVTSLGGSFATSLLVSGDSALLGLIIVVTWQYAGYIMMIYIAALQNVPQDLIEASKIDGANAIQRLQTIILPLVAQAFTVSMFLTLITSFKQYDTVISLTNGGPGTLMPKWIADLFGLPVAPAVSSNNLIAINIYQEAFSRYQLGVGQAKAIVFFAFLLVISLLQVYYNKRKEVEF